MGFPISVEYLLSELLGTKTRERRKTDHVEFGKDKVCFRRIRAIVKEDDETFAVFNHLTQCRPI